MGKINDRGQGRGACKSASAKRRFGALGAVVVACLVHWAPCAAQAPAPAAQHLRIVGGLGALNQYTRHEEPFWTRELARLSGGMLAFWHDPTRAILFDLGSNVREIAT